MTPNPETSSKPDATGGIRSSEWLGALPEAWTVNDPRMWREQCRVGDVAFQHLFCVSKGKPLPDWVTEGLPKMYQLLGEHARYREALQRIATSHPIDDEPLATAHSLRAHKALRPDCKCGRCAPNESSSPTPAQAAASPQPEGEKGVRCSAWLGGSIPKH